MKPNGKVIWIDPYTKKPTGILHEIIFGNPSRDICIEFNIQLPVTWETHQNLHGHKVMGSMNPMMKFYDQKQKKFSQDGMKADVIENIFGLNYFYVSQAVNIIDRPVLKEISITFLKILKTMEY